MTAEEPAEQNQEEVQSSTSWVLVAAFWAYVTIPLAWGVYETLGGVTDLFTGG